MSLLIPGFHYKAVAESVHLPGRYLADLLGRSLGRKDTGHPCTKHGLVLLTGPYMFLLGEFG